MMSVLVSELVSVRVPTCPLQRAKLAMSDTIFRDRYIREVHTVAVLAARAGVTLVDQIEWQGPLRQGRFTFHRRRPAKESQGSGRIGL